MRAIERTRQALDPVGTVGNRLLTVTAAIAAFVIAALTIALYIDHLENPFLAIVALMSLGAASALIVVRTDPYRGLVTHHTHYLVVVLALVADLFLTFAVGMARLFLTVDWVIPLALGLLYIALAAYRPAREMIGVGGIAGIAIGFSTMIQVRYVELDLPVLAVVGSTVMPLLALNFAATAFSLSTIHSIERWQRRATRAEHRASAERETGIARSVQQDRVTILNREVVPFFGELVRKQTVTDADRERAREIANAIRTVMVAEVDRTWLENVIIRLRSRIRTEPNHEALLEGVHDDDHVANLMSYDQRTGLRALIVAAFELSNGEPESFQLMLSRDGDLCTGVVSMHMEMADAAVKVRFGPYISVMRVVFDGLRVEYLQSVLTLRFFYEQR